MTVCIAAISQFRRVIIAASDMMLSDEVSSADLATFKLSPLFKGGRWWGMYAGLPTDFEELRCTLDEVEQPLNVIDATLAVERAYDALTRHYIDRYVLSPFGLTHEEFVKDGLEIFGETYFRELAEQCRQVKPQTETTLLVMGFDSRKAPHIFEARRGEKCEVLDELGFHAIGTGAWSAQGSLFANDFRGAVGLSEAVYRVCEAKFVSETARSVGTEITVVNVFFPDGTDSELYIDQDNVIRAAWERHRNLPVPPEAIKEIEKDQKLKPVKLRSR